MLINRPKGEIDMKNEKRWMLMLLSLLLVAGTEAKEIKLTPPINSVKVHPDSAFITRKSAITIPEGEHQLVLSGLPGNLDPARIRLASDSKEVRFGGLEIVEFHLGGLTSENEKSLRTKLEGLQDSKKIITDSVETANTEISLLMSLASGSQNAAIKPTVNGAELTGLVSAVSDRSSNAKKRIREASIRLRKLNKQIEKVRFELNQIATNRKTSSEVRATLRSPKAIDTHLYLSYPEQNAAWKWIYEARLNSESRQLSITRQASVIQNSDEDWSKIDLTLTTANSRVDPGMPELGPMFVDIYKERKFPARNAAPALDKFEGNFRAKGMIEEVVVTGYRVTDDARTIATQYLVEFQIPGKVTITNQQESKVLPIDEKKFAVNLVGRAIPEFEQSAYLLASFKFTEDTPIHEGEMQYYRDGTFIGSNYISPFLPGEEIDLEFGIDERIRIEQQFDAEESKEGGLFSRTNIEESRVRYQVTSFHPKPIDMEVIARIPVSRNSAIEVKMADDATPPDEKDLDGKSGVMMWRFEIAPQKMKVLNNYYKITYPKDADLDYEDESDW